MTYNGQFSPTKVKVPYVGHRSFQSSVNGLYHGGYWIPFNLTDTDTIYTETGVTSLKDPLQQQSSSQYFPFTTFATSRGHIHPEPIGSQFYMFGHMNNQSLLFNGTSIWRAHVEAPDSWDMIGGTLIDDIGSSDVDFVYVDNDNGYCYIIANGNIQRSELFDMFTWTHVGSAPIVGAAYVVLGSTIYAYGGDGPSTNIYSTSTSTFTGWSLSGDALPAGSARLTPYLDVSGIYLFGGQEGTFDKIYKAEIASPTVVTSVGTLGSNGLGGIRGTLVREKYSSGKYFLSSGTRAWINEGSNLSTGWVEYSGTLATATADAQVYTTDTHIYCVGGITTGGTAINTIQYAPKSNPTFWRNHTDTLPANLTGGQVIKTRDYYYLLGANGTTGHVYKAPISDPTDWTLDSTSGPTRSHGRAAVIGPHVWYWGGETTALTASVHDITKATIRRQATLDEWVSVSGAGTVWMPSAIPVDLARFALIVAGNYIYAIGGHTDGVINTTVYRARIDRLMGSTGSATAEQAWLSVGTLTNSPVDAAVAVANNTVFIIGGSTAMPLSISDGGSDRIIMANLTTLANGADSTAFVSHDGMLLRTGVSTYGIIGSKATCVDGAMYLLGGRVFNTTEGTTTVWRTHSVKEQILVGGSNFSQIAEPNLAVNYPSSAHILSSKAISVPTIDPESGALGSYTPFQRHGMLPWLVDWRNYPEGL